MAGEIGAFAVLLGIMVATVLMVGAGERLRLPYPVLVLLLGVLLAVVPVLPNLHVAPELILPLFLPPLIFAAARRTSWRTLWRGRYGVVWLAVVLVLVTMAAVGWTAWLVLPGVSVAGAAALGALVAPPDPVAAEAVAGPIGLPRRLVTTLQNEGLCNDATALVAYGVAAHAITGGAPSVPVAVLTFLYEVAAAVLLGLGVGWLARKLLLLIAEPTARSGLTLVVPFAGYLAADGIGASGVLAVLTVGLFLGHTEDDDTGVADRLIGGAFWDTVELLVTGIAFGLIGYLGIDDKILARVVDAYRRIRNTLRFLMANVSDFDPAQDAVPFEQMLEIDRYALSRAAQLQADILAHYEVYEFHPVVSKLQIYCSEDLGSFYLDILKDRLYTTGPKSLARRSAQTALWQITHAMLRWMAPFLSFTAEEAWKVFGQSESIFLETYASFQPQDEALLAKWSRIREIRDAVNKDIEALRADGKVGSSLQANVALEINADDHALLASLGDDLKFVFITSAIDLIAGSAIQSRVKASSAAKCERCWHYREDVGHDAAHPTICGRCTSNLYGAGEDRKFA